MSLHHWFIPILDNINEMNFWHFNFNWNLAPDFHWDLLLNNVGDPLFYFDQLSFGDDLGYSHLDFFYNFLVFVCNYSLFYNFLDLEDLLNLHFDNLFHLSYLDVLDYFLNFDLFDYLLSLIDRHDLLSDGGDLFYLFDHPIDDYFLCHCCLHKFFSYNMDRNLAFDHMVNWVFDINCYFLVHSHDLKFFLGNDYRV